MESLFDFVFSNLWILIILFGVVSSLFGGDKKKEQKHRPQLDIPSMRTEKNMEPKREVRPAEVKAPVEENKPQIHEDKTIVSEQLRYMQEQLARKAAQIDEKVTAIQSDRGVPKKQVGNLPSLQQKNNLVNGVVMAEILGPPRAKKPMHKMK